MRFRKKTVLYAAGVLACGNIALQALGFVYRVMLSRFAGAEGLGMYRLANSGYLVLHTGCLSGVTMACSRPPPPITKTFIYCSSVCRYMRCARNISTISATVPMEMQVLASVHTVLNR